MSKIMHVTLSAVPNPDHSRNSHSGSVNIPEKKCRVTDFVRASATCRAFIEHHELGAGNFTGGAIFVDGVQVAHVSYNGRIWWGKSNPPKTGKEVKFYKDFQNIQIPEFLDNPSWQDESWGNDVTARSSQAFSDTRTIEVWVFADLQSEREDAENSPYKYNVSVYGDDGNLKFDETGTPCNTKAEVLAAIEKYRTLLEKEKSS